MVPSSVASLSRLVRCAKVVMSCVMSAISIGLVARIRPGRDSARRAVQREAAAFALQLPLLLQLIGNVEQLRSFGGGEILHVHQRPLPRVQRAEGRRYGGRMAHPGLLSLLSGREGQAPSRPFADVYHFIGVIILSRRP